jgi:hypothetical protein
MASNNYNVGDYPEHLIKGLTPSPKIWLEMSPHQRFGLGAERAWLTARELYTLAVTRNLNLFRYIYCYYQIA